MAGPRSQARLSWTERLGDPDVLGLLNLVVLLIPIVAGAMHLSSTAARLATPPSAVDVAEREGVPNVEPDPDPGDRRDPDRSIERARARIQATGSVAELLIGYGL